MKMEQAPGSGIESERLQEAEQLLAAYQRQEVSPYKSATQEGAAQSELEQALDARPDIKEAVATTDQETYDQILAVLDEAQEPRKFESLEFKTLITPEFWKKAQPILEAVVATLKLVGLVSAALVVPGAGFEPLAIAAFLEQAIKIKEIYHALRKLRENAPAQEAPARSVAA